MTARLPRGPVMVDVEGFALTDAERKRLSHPLAGGVILFARNFRSSRQLAALTAEIRALREPQLLIAVDHEGGRVQRFRTDGFTHLPPMRAFGRKWDEDRESALKMAHAAGFVLAAELRAHGVDLSFTPVLDLDYGGSRVIGDRAFHRDPAAVAALAGALVDGLKDAGMGAVGKHFPGHGFVAADSHLEIPVDERDFDTVWADDIAPYRTSLGRALAGVMPAHVNYPNIDSRPAGFSAFWLQDVLRGRLGFQGVIFSDDLTMEGASVAGGIVARCDAASAAGCDMMLVCNRPDLVDELFSRWEPVVAPECSARIDALCAQVAVPTEELAEACARARTVFSALVSPQQST
ncbi:MAG TPA: beta-N-acetylhexosaminidase [Azoarcus sp.]|nr:beta-N-acetylhexosaminidase [Azoarcus sp.]